MGEINMLVAKFVDDNYKYNNISYVNFGTPIEKVTLVLPINEDVSFNCMRFGKKAILLEISEENIVECQRNTYFKVNKFTPVRNLNDEELSILRTVACHDPYYAYWYARDVDQKPTNETRSAVCKNPDYAYWYARNIDQKPTDETRTAACKNSENAYYYALNVDQKPTNETRTAACKNMYFAYLYAKDVDQKPTDKTRTVVSKNQYYKERYEQWERSIC
jgi:hypothetical protein